MATNTKDDQDENDNDNKSVGGKKKLIIILAAVLLLIGGGAGAYFGGLLGGGKDKAQEAAPVEEAADDGKGGAAPKDGAPKYDEHGNLIGGPVFYEMPEFLVNLSTTGQKVSFLKMKVTLELAGPQSVPVVEANKPRISDAFNTYLRELRASDLSGSAGIYRLREELLTRVNKAIHPEQVKDILFSEIIVQ